MGHHSHHQNEHVEHKSHKKLYFIIFFALAVLTGLEMLVPEMNISYALKAFSLTFLALGKAFLVAYIFMHLNEETKWMKFIAAVPVFAALFAIVLCIESIIR
jgi:cytochrome c oxidase subunit 4